MLNDILEARIYRSIAFRVFTGQSGNLVQLRHTYENTLTFVKEITRSCSSKVNLSRDWNWVSWGWGRASLPLLAVLLLQPFKLTILVCESA
jgi:hypothetical protein